MNASSNQEGTLGNYLPALSFGGACHVFDDAVDTHCARDEEVHPKPSAISLRLVLGLESHIFVSYAVIINHSVGYLVPGK